MAKSKQKKRSFRFNTMYSGFLSPFLQFLQQQQAVTTLHMVVVTIKSHLLTDRKGRDVPVCKSDTMHKLLEVSPLLGREGGVENINPLTPRVKPLTLTTEP